MRTIEFSRQFHKDFKAITRSPYGKRAAKRLEQFMGCWINSQELPASFRDHALVGRLRGQRDAHILPDVVVLYAVNGDALQLIRMGSHSTLNLA